MTRTRGTLRGRHRPPSGPDAGLETFRVPLPGDWTYARGELASRYEPTYTTSDLTFGVNNGGKHSIDVTYLAGAEATRRGEVAPLHVVRDLSMDDRRRWVLEADRVDTGGAVQEHLRITADAVFLNAGSPGTTRLMVKAKAKGLMPDLPDAVGSRWGNNGDRIFAWVQMDGNPGRPQDLGSGGRRRPADGTPARPENRKAPPRVARLRVTERLPPGGPS